MNNIKVIERKLKNVDDKICCLIDELYTHDRKWVSDMIVQFLRTFVEHVCALVYAADNSQKEVIISYTRIGEYTNYVKCHKKYAFLGELRDSLNKSVSHFVPEGDGAERLMLMYYDSLVQIKKLVKERFDIDLLHNLKEFPTDIDRTLDVYYVAILGKLLEQHDDTYEFSGARYYVLNSQPVIVNGHLFYEITLALARNNINKVDRFIAFSKTSLKQNYAVQLDMSSHKININGFEVPIMIINEWQISIRPCELQKVIELRGYETKVKSNGKMYNAIMNYLTTTGNSLLDVLLFNDDEYTEWKESVYLNTDQSANNAFLELRDLVLSNKPGSNIVRYLLSYLRNDVIKDQLSCRSNNLLSYLYVVNECKPFDDMPFASSLYKHNVSYSELMQCIEFSGREHEFLAKMINDKAYNDNMLYVDSDNKEYDEYLIEKFNKKLYTSHKQQQRKLGTFGNMLCVNYNVDITEKILLKLKDYTGTGIENYSNDMEDWISSRTDITDEVKKDILRKLYKESMVGIIYGAAGTGKTKVIEYVSEYFSSHSILFLANTNTAVDNLRRRTNDKFTCKTMYSYLKGRIHGTYDMIVVDECSMISNNDMYELLKLNNTDMLLLVGDVYQIESIEFGNWFNFARYFLDKASVNELTTPFRAKDNQNLLEVWKSVRTYDEHMFLKMQSGGYVEELSDDVFVRRSKDEIILCLGYNGIYGINNINRFLQEKNNSDAIQWGVWSYKVGDPILFMETKRFGNILYNNLKGTIVNIQKDSEKIRFTVEIEKNYSEYDFYDSDISFIRYGENGNSVIAFDVENSNEQDDDNDNPKDIVPFQIAYAISIHKAQGLEYDSVKVVITKDIQERISHSVFYTAITRAKKNLKVYMSSEVQSLLVERFVKDNTALSQAKKFSGHRKMKFKNLLSTE